MKRTNAYQSVRAVSLSLLLVLSVTVGAVALSGSAGAAVNSGTVEVTEDVVSSDDTITVTGDLDSTSGDTVAFRLVGPDGNQDFVSKSDGDDGGATTVTSSLFSAEISLTNDVDGSQFGDGEVTVFVDHRDGYIESDDSATVRLDDTAPAVDVDDVSEPTSAPTIEGNVSDENLDTVEIAIRDSSDDYYDDESSGFDSESRVWLSVDETSSGEWRYDTTSLDLSDGDYRVYVRASDTAGNTRSYFDGPNPGDLKESFTLDTTDPTINSVSVTDETDGDGDVQVGDTVSVSADVSETTSGVESVTVNASALGGDSSLTLLADSADTYEGEFTVSDPNVSDGSQSLPVTATDTNGNTKEDSSGSITLVTAVGSVSNLTVHQEFIGIVQDEQQTVRVTADSVTDPRGNTIENKEVTLSVGDHSYDVDVDGGSIDQGIDPEAISNTHSTGVVTVELAGVESETAPSTVELVHETDGLDEGYQIRGTPMDAEEISYQYVDRVTTYNTSNSDWEVPSAEQAGSAYYVSGKNDSARIGYTFSATSDGSARHLVEGYNLVTATPDLNDGGPISLTEELDGITFGSDDVYFTDVSELSDPEESTSGSEFTTADSTTEDVSEYKGFYVYVDSGEKWGVITETGYDPAEGS